MSLKVVAGLLVAVVPLAAVGIRPLSSGACLAHEWTNTGAKNSVFSGRNAAHDLGNSSVNTLLQGAQQTTSGASPHAPSVSQLYLAGREALVRSDEATAMREFTGILDQYPKSSYVPQALYYVAFLNFRRYQHLRDSEPPAPSPAQASQATRSLQTARVVLSRLQREHPRAPQVADARILQARVCGELSQRGAACPADAGSSITVDVAGATKPSKTEASCSTLNVDEFMVTFGSAWRGDTAMAIGGTRQILNNRDRCYRSLRQRIILPMMGREVPSLVPLMLSLARTDADPLVRRRATIWLMGQPRDAELARSLDALMVQNINEGSGTTP